MDEFSTPIEQIRPDMKQDTHQPNVNYSDMLQSMEQNNMMNSDNQMDNKVSNEYLSFSKHVRDAILYFFTPINSK